MKRKSGRVGLFGLRVLVVLAVGLQTVACATQADNPVKERDPDAVALVQKMRSEAERGNPEAELGMALAYIQGRGVPRDDATGVIWLRRAADQGHPMAQYTLAIMYRDGVGVTKDKINAYKWASLAIPRWKEIEGIDLEEVVSFRDDLAKSMTPKQIAEADKLVREWQKTTMQ